MSTIQRASYAMPGPAAQGLNITNVAGDYHDHHNQTTAYHYHTTTVNSPSRIGPLDRLLDHVSHGALHDSAERGDAPKCYPETRTTVQRDIMNWIRCDDGDDTPKRFLWLTGPAGSGKTAIAGTITDECYKQGLLAASFFFSAFAGSKSRRWKKLVIPTLVYRLIQHKSIIGLREEVLAVIEDDPVVFERHLDQQLEELILKPLRRVADRSNMQDWPRLIIIDALDECQDDEESPGSNSQKEILSALSRACTDPVFPFRVIISSRPESTIKRFFTSTRPALNIFLDDKYRPDADIRLFLDAMFSEIGRRFHLPSTWASKDVIGLLVRESSGQFIYATTVIQFINNTRLGPPQQQLRRLLDWRRLDKAEPFAPLDAVYNRIIHTSPEPLRAVEWISLIRSEAALKHPAWYLKGLLESYPGETEYVLGSLTSLVGLVDEQGEPCFHFYHNSLFDFLADRSRCSDLYVDEETIARLLSDRYYQVLKGRGPRSIVSPSTTPWLPPFLDTFCGCLGTYLDPRRGYTREDVEWWLANLGGSVQRLQLPRMIASIHLECTWYHCLPSCRVWRKGIKQYYREHDWPVPRKVDALRAKLKRFETADVKGGEYGLGLCPQSRNIDTPVWVKDAKQS